ncbi:MAG: prepilin-type N-terminal cleavage/methylation domain-containing protein [Nitrospirae bacterium]|nr:MAG: prepilin-type N-terminal cleavage/methylation domain-containing protein [Nitrospirota bacterium]
MSRRALPHESPVHGYTLTELLVVLGILGLVGVLGGGWWLSALPHTRLNGAVRFVRSDLLAARMQAIAQGHKVRVTFIDDTRYSMVQDINGNGRVDPGEDQTVRDLREAFPGVTIQSTNNPIFHPRGTASNLATVTLRNSAGIRTVTISITGRVRVQVPQP